LGELRSVLDVLRHGDEGPPRAPAVGLDDLAGLAARTTAAGLTVRTEFDGVPRPLPAGVDLAAYRIVQEALTNVARHAGPATATVRVSYGDDEVVVQVDDDGQGPPGFGGVNGGKGLAGMRERVAALGGQFDAGPGPAGGFRVRAQLPAEAGP
jgi:signal transduction histidine kinase